MFCVCLRHGGGRRHRIVDEEAEVIDVIGVQRVA